MDRFQYGDKLLWVGLKPGFRLQIRKEIRIKRLRKYLVKEVRSVTECLIPKRLLVLPFWFRDHLTCKVTHFFHSLLLC